MSPIFEVQIRYPLGLLWIANNRHPDLACFGVYCVVLASADRSAWTASPPPLLQVKEINLARQWPSLRLTQLLALQRQPEEAESSSVLA